MTKPNTPNPSPSAGPSETVDSLLPHEHDLLAFSLFLAEQLELPGESTEDRDASIAAHSETIWRANQETRAKWWGRAKVVRQLLQMVHLDVEVKSSKKAKQASIDLKTIPATAAY